MKKLVLALASLALAAGSALAAGMDREVRAYYESVNVLKALMSHDEIDALARQKGDSPIAAQLESAGIKSRTRIEEIERNLKFLQSFDVFLDGRPRKGGVSLPRLKDDFELVKGLRESKDRIDVSLAYYKAFGGNEAEIEKREIISDFEGGRIDREGILKRIDYGKKSVLGQRDETWIRNKGTWVISPSAAELIR
jgi:hypothetical protein